MMSAWWLALIIPASAVIGIMTAIVVAALVITSDDFPHEKRSDEDDYEDEY